MLDFVKEDGFGFETYSRYALDVPMYFVKRDGRYIDVAGSLVRGFHGRPAGAVPGVRATIKIGWTIPAPSSRRCGSNECPGDAGGRRRILVAAWPPCRRWAFSLYDPAARAAAWDLCKHWTAEDRARLRSGVARTALKAEVAGRSVQDIAKDMLVIAHGGLRNRNRLSAGLVDETTYLTEIEEIAETGVTAAERMLERYQCPWAGDANKAFRGLRVLGSPCPPQISAPLLVSS